MASSSGSSSTIRFTFLCGIRGYHEYKLQWAPVLDEVLKVQQQPANPHDCYAIAVKKRLPGALYDSVVGHLPKEISRYTYFIINQGGRVTCKVKNTHYRRSPLVQGGLEIPAEVTVEMDTSEENSSALREYEKLVGEYYEEPVDGQHSDATAAILESLKCSSESEDTSTSTDDPASDQAEDL